MNCTLLRCVQTERKANPRGGVIAYKFNAEVDARFSLKAAWVEAEVCVEKVWAKKKKKKSMCVLLPSYETALPVQTEDKEEKWKESLEENNRNKLRSW